MDRVPLVALTIVLSMFCRCESQSIHDVWDCPLMLESCELLTGIQGAKGINGEPGLPGLRGTTGLTGTRGACGEPGTIHGGGTITIKGTKGNRGTPGKRGRPGINGPAGHRGDLGNSGRPGRHGIPGRKGNTGFPGPPGTKGDAGDIANSNWKQCTFTLDVNKQNGEIHACTFQKLLSNTALHVTYQGDTHVSLCGTCCKKWEFLFDGKPCSSPGPIDAVYDSLMLVNNNRPSVLPVFWHGSISGYCSNHLSGPVRVAMVIKNCSDFPTDSIHVSSQVTITGRIIIQEVPPSQQ